MDRKKPLVRFLYWFVDSLHQWELILVLQQHDATCDDESDYSKDDDDIDGDKCDGDQHHYYFDFELMVEMCLMKKLSPSQMMLMKRVDG